MTYYSPILLPYFFEVQQPKKNIIKMVQVTLPVHQG